MPKTKKIDYTVEAGGSFTGKVEIPGDKSISHRALMLGAIADGMTKVHGFLESEDTIATLEALRAMGVEFDEIQPQRITIHGVGLHGLRDPGKPLNLGNSGTSVRLLSGLLAGQSFDSELTGDESLQIRCSAWVPISAAVTEVLYPSLSAAADCCPEFHISCPWPAHR